MYISACSIMHMKATIVSDVRSSPTSGGKTIRLCLKKTMVFFLPSDFLQNFFNIHVDKLAQMLCVLQ